MRKRRTDFWPHEENVFALSTGDLMASLLFIFILLLTGALLQVRDKSAEDEERIKECETSLAEAEKNALQSESDAEEYKRLLTALQEKSEQNESDLAEYMRLLSIERQKSEQNERKAREYQNIKAQIYEELYEEFRDRLEEWHASIDKDTLAIRFKKPEMMFDRNEDELKPEYRKILDSFFPSYIRVLLKKETGTDQFRFKDHIVEIRIEGHTDSDSPPESACPPGRDGRPNSNCGYYFNMQLSQNRARNVLKYCMDMMQGREENGWLIKVLTANGMSYSHLICPDGTEDCPAGRENKQLSRRVEFRVRTDAEKQLESIADLQEW